MNFTTPTLNCLAVLLSQVSVSAGDAEFESKVKTISDARRELLTALEERAKEEGKPHPSDNRAARRRAGKAMA